MSPIDEAVYMDVTRLRSKFFKMCCSHGSYCIGKLPVFVQRKLLNQFYLCLVESVHGNEERL